jgi:predicted phage terminase large subunit-like protein
MGQKGERDWKAWHFTSLDNPLIDPEEIEVAKASMSSFAFRQEFMASFEAPQSELFKEDWIVVKDKDEEPSDGTYFIGVDLAGFESVASSQESKKRYLDKTAISVVKVHQNGWWVDKIEAGRWDIKETSERILKLCKIYDVSIVGIERGTLKRAITPYMQEMMREKGIFPRVEEVVLGNKSKVDKIIGALQGRFEHRTIVFREADWNRDFKDELLNFPTKGVHDDMVDSLSLITHISTTPFELDEYYDEYEPLDAITGY